MPTQESRPDDDSEPLLRLAREAALSDADSYYVRRGEQLGEWVRSAYMAMRPDDDEVPVEVVVNVLVAWVYSKRERGLW